MNHPSNMKMNAFLLIATLLFSCKENRSGSEMDLFAPAEEMKMMAEARDESPVTVDFSLNVPPTEQGAPQEVIADRKLIRNGTLEFQTGEVKKTKAEIEKVCKELNAYISSEGENNYGDRLQYNQVIRVPANQFDVLLSRIEPLARKIENKNINTEDVTEQFIDVEARLKTKKELEARYREILKQAMKVEDIVSIESQIANVRSEIESMEGRLNYLRNQVAFSTLNVTYYETIGTDFGFASKFIQSLKGGWDNLLAFIIFLFNLWPFVLVLSALAFWFWKKRMNRKAKIS